MAPNYRKMSDLKPDEREAAASYYAASGLFHLATQCYGNMALDQFQEYVELVSGSEFGFANGCVCALRAYN